MHPIPEPGDPLRSVAGRRQPSAHGRKAVIDTLDCGHTIIDYNGGRPARRRCRQCGHARDEKYRTELAVLDAHHGQGRASSGTAPPRQRPPAAGQRTRAIQEACGVCGVGPGAPCVVPREAGGFLAELAQEPHDLSALRG